MNCRFGKMSVTTGGNFCNTSSYLGGKEEATSEVDIYTGFWRDGNLDGLTHIT